MEDPLAVRKSLTTQDNIIEDSFSFFLAGGAIVYKFDMDVMEYMSYAMFYTIANQFLHPEEKILVGSVSKDLTSPKPACIQGCRIQGRELEASREHVLL